MNDFSSVQAYDVLRFATPIEERLSAAQRELTTTAATPREQAWLNEALELVTAEKANIKKTLEEARVLPELGEVRLEVADELQEKWVDALEKLQSGIAYHSSPRDPVIEALFPHQKFPALRRASRELVEQYANELERRYGSSYVTRIFAQETYAFAPAVIEQVRRALADWRSCFAESALSDAEARPLRHALVSLASKVDIAIQQAKLLAQAALVSYPGRFDELGLGLKPKKRAPKPGDAWVGGADLGSSVEASGIESALESVSAEEVSPAVEGEAALPADSAEAGAGSAGSAPAHEESVGAELGSRPDGAAAASDDGAPAVDQTSSGGAPSLAQTPSDDSEHRQESVGAEAGAPAPSKASRAPRSRSAADAEAASVATDATSAAAAEIATAAPAPAPKGRGKKAR